MSVRQRRLDRINFNRTCSASWAEAHLTNGRNEAGLQVIDKALEAVQGGERFYEAELRRLQGELQLAQNSHSTSEPEQCFLLSHRLQLVKTQTYSLFVPRLA